LSLSVCLFIFLFIVFISYPRLTHPYYHPQAGARKFQLKVGPAYESYGPYSVVTPTLTAATPSTGSFTFEGANGFGKSSESALLEYYRRAWESLAAVPIERRQLKGKRLRSSETNTNTNEKPGEKETKIEKEKEVADVNFLRLEGENENVKRAKTATPPPLLAFKRDASNRIFLHHVCTLV
jgi:hypothetical protein